MFPDKKSKIVMIIIDIHLFDSPKEIDLVVESNFILFFNIFSLALRLWYIYAQKKFKSFWRWFE